MKPWRNGRRGEVRRLVEAREAARGRHHRADVRALLEDPAQAGQDGGSVRTTSGTPPPRRPGGAAAIRPGPCGGQGSSACRRLAGPRCLDLQVRSPAEGLAVLDAARGGRRPAPGIGASLEVPVQRHEGRLGALLDTVLELLEEAGLPEPPSAHDPEGVRRPSRMSRRIPPRPKKFDARTQLPAMKGFRIVLGSSLPHSRRQSQASARGERLLGAGSSRRAVSFTA